MGTRLRVFLVALAFLVGCAAWPRVKCEPVGKETADTHLAMIDLLANGLKDAAIQRRVHDAVFVCRKNCHRDALKNDAHCAAVINAVRWAIKGKWDKTLLCLEHGSKEFKCDAPTATKEGDWPDLLCGGLTARDRLTAIQLLANMANSGCAGALLKRVNDAIDACLEHDDFDPNNPNWPTFAQHCQWVMQAYSSAIAAAVSMDSNQWTQCAQELEHMVGTL